MDIETARFNMIEQQIRPWDVLDAGVLALLSTVRREDFVPPAMRALAFVDTQIPLLPGEPGGPRMLEPRVQARLLQSLQVQRHEKALEIGTGAGFMAALLAHRAQSVVTLESHPELARMARENLRRNGVLNARVVEVRPDEGARGYPAEAPFDVILLSGSVAEVPRVLLEQLRIGGRLAAIVGNEPVMQATVFTRTSQAAWSQQAMFQTLAPRLQGFAEKPAFSF
ncbi:MAG: protein-L-isoaspartate O-methyltransferase [Rubrivivax sp.]|jgi:protein-L-isoaspartate(D-aspartate) O-methyltransferase|nr:protein-L-isoaspartate O-methyltransferase [Rubrivivax sp.]